MTEGIEGKILVVTGASSGLGEAARLLSAQVAAAWFARAASFARSQPPEVNEILYRPIRQEL